VPAESIRPDRSRTVAIAHVLANQYALTSHSLHQLGALKQQLFSMGRVSAIPVPKLNKIAFINSIDERKGMDYDLL